MRSIAATCRPVAVVMVLAFLACTEREEPTSPRADQDPPGASSRSISVPVKCEARISASELRCGAAAEAHSEFGPYLVIVGGQGSFVQLTSFNVSYDAGTQILQADVTVQNLIGQALGTPDGVSITGVRGFFHVAPTVTAGTGTVGVANPDGFGTFTGSNQAYFEYNEILTGGTPPPPAPGQTSQPKAWRFNASPDISFEFLVLVESDVMFPDGWVDVTPPEATIQVGDSQTATAVVRDVVGRPLPGRTLTWSSKDLIVASVDPTTGEAAGLAAGSSNICGTSDGIEAQGCMLLAVLPPGGTAAVEATVETDPSHHVGDTADDMAIWVHPTDPSLSLVVGDDKEGGLMVWGLDGKELQYVDGTNYNNLDLRYNFPLAGQFGGGAAHQTVALVGVGDELGRQIDFFKVNPSTRQLETAGSIDTEITPYGGCMYHSVYSGRTYFFVNAQSGVVQQWDLGDGGGGEVSGTLVREFDVGSITEGCVADDHLGHFYIGEEDVGIWKYGAEPGAGTSRTQVDATGAGGHLVADVEGLSIYYTGETTGYLLASSQGESRIVIYTREGANTFKGKLEVEGSGTIDDVAGTDGLDVTNVPLSTGFDQGLLAVHDGGNSGATASNVKYVPWRSVAAALGLKVDTSYDPRTVAQ